MKELLENIFLANGFSRPILKENAFFFEANDLKRSEYYLVDFIEGDKVKGYLESDAMENIFALFNDQKRERQDVEKNTSLIICVKVTNIQNEIGIIRNDILKIEEDDYWFKKYVIVYSDNSLPLPTPEINYIQHFSDLLINSDAFREYKTNIYQNESYYLTIEMFLKIPFINVPIKETANYRSIEELLAKKLSIQEKDLLSKLRFFTDIYEPTLWDKIKSDSVLTSGVSNSSNDFLDRFKPNA